MRMSTAAISTPNILREKAQARARPQPRAI
jgi:hypothetical protein